jgi:hypothetical protein
MPAASAQMQMGKKLRGKKGALRYGAQMSGSLGGPGDRGPGGRQIPGKIREAMLEKRGKMRSMMGGPGDRGPGGQRIAGQGQPEAVTPAAAPPEPVAAPMPTGGSGASADVGTGGTGAFDMGPTPKGVQDAGAGGGGRLVRPGSGLIQPAAPTMPAPAEAVPAAGPAVAQAAPMAKMLAMRQPLSGFQPRIQPKKKGGAGRFFTGQGA